MTYNTDDDKQQTV